MGVLSWISIQSGRGTHSPFILCSLHAGSWPPDRVDEALRVPQTELRLFGKPESFTKRRMGVALAYAEDVDTARERAKEAAGKVKPRKA